MYVLFLCALFCDSMLLYCVVCIVLVKQTFFNEQKWPPNFFGAGAELLTNKYRIQKIKYTIQKEYRAGQASCTSKNGDNSPRRNCANAEFGEDPLSDQFAFLPSHP